MDSENPYATPQVHDPPPVVHRPQLGRASLIATLGTLGSCAFTAGFVLVPMVDKLAMRECLAGAMLGAIAGVFGCVPALIITLIPPDRFRIATALFSVALVTATANYLINLIIHIHV
jgi:hypothetical protein